MQGLLWSVTKSRLLLLLLSRIWIRFSWSGLAHAVMAHACAGGQNLDASFLVPRHQVHASRCGYPLRGRFHHPNNPTLRHF